MLNKHAHPPRLCDVVSQVYIVKYCEDTRQLEDAFRNAGLRCETVTKNYSADECAYASTARVLLTHCEAWKCIIVSNEPALVVEADFVPCKGFEQLPLPYPYPERVWCWLYTGTSIAYELVSDKYMRGHAASPVATLIYPALARNLIEFANNELFTNNPYEYVPWDSYVDYKLRKYGWQTYIAYRSFGEHGGIGDPIHSQHGLARTHRADCIAGPLLFMPAYAEKSRFKFYMIRIIAKIKGLGKLIFLRRIDKGTFKRLLIKPGSLLKLLRYEFGRLMTLH